MRSWSQSNKYLEICSNNDDCDHDRSPIKTQKHDIFMKIAIIVVIFRNRTFLWRSQSQKLGHFNEDCDHRNYFFVRTLIMVSVLCIPEICIFETVRFFWSDNCGAFASFPLRSASALDTWVHVIGLKKEVVEMNKIMKLSFFSIYDLI